MADQSSRSALADARDRLIVAARSLGRDVVFDELLPSDLNHQIGPAVELSDDLVALWTVANPRDVRVPFSRDDLELFPAQDIAWRHDGYTGPGWNPTWVLLGGVAGDPVIADTASPATPVMLAIHGTGAWRPHVVAPDPPAFLTALSTWLEVLARFDGQRLDAARDFDVKPGFDAILRRELQQVLPKDCTTNLINYIST